MFIRKHKVCTCKSSKPLKIAFCHPWFLWGSELVGQLNGARAKPQSTDRCFWSRWLGLSPGFAWLWQTQQTSQTSKGRSMTANDLWREERGVASHFQRRHADKDFQSTESTERTFICYWMFPIMTLWFQILLEGHLIFDTITSVLYKMIWRQYNTFRCVKHTNVIVFNVYMCIKLLYEHIALEM